MTDILVSIVCNICNKEDFIVEAIKVFLMQKTNSTRDINI